MSSSNSNVATETSRRKRKSRWSDAPPPAAAPAAAGTAEDKKAKALALKESIRAKLDALKQKKRPLPPPPPQEAPQQEQRPVKKAKHFDLNLDDTRPTFAEKPKPKVNPYLTQQQEEEEEQNDVEDDRLARASKPRQRHKALTFVEPGTFVEIAERKRMKAANALQAGFVSGRKTGMHFQSSNMASVYGSAGDKVVQQESETVPRADSDPSSKTPLPLVMEWWDVELLPSKLKKQVAAEEGKVLSQQTKAQLQQLTTTTASEKDDSDNADTEQLRVECFQQASLVHSKTAALVQHIVPIQTKSVPAKQPVLHLTKKELKRARKLRRAEKQRELQDMQAAGLIPPPEPRLTLKNFIRVMGDQAVLDPSQMERKVEEQVQARQQAHLERNEAKKLSKEERSEKRARKLQEDTSGGVTVALFYVKDMSHPYHRAKVELNARQNYLTGGVVECENPSLACVICEGGPKAIKRYTRLMLVRMKWTGTDVGEQQQPQNDEEEAETHKFNPENKCELVWTGMATRRMFKSFVFQSCETSDVAAKVLRSKGVGHFWDQVLTHASGLGQSVPLKLVDDDDSDVNMEDA